MEPTLTMRPNFFARIASKVSLHRLKQDPRLVSITASHMSRLILAITPSRVMPALLTSISMAPCSSWMRVTAAWHAAKSPASNRSTAMPVSAWKASAAFSLPA